MSPVDFDPHKLQTMPQHEISFCRDALRAELGRLTLALRNGEGSDPEAAEEIQGDIDLTRGRIRLCRAALEGLSPSGKRGKMAAAELDELIKELVAEGVIDE